MRAAWLPAEVGREGRQKNVRPSSYHSLDTERPPNLVAESAAIRTIKPLAVPHDWVFDWAQLGGSVAPRSSRGCRHGAYPGWSTQLGSHA